MNLTISIGNLVDDPQISQTNSGKKYARFKLALNRFGEGADFPSFIAWEGRAELMEKWCHKGQKIGVRGHIQTGSYEKDGKKSYTTDIVVDELEFCEKKGEAKQDAQEDDFVSIPEGVDGEIPFS